MNFNYWNKLKNFKNLIFLNYISLRKILDAAQGGSSPQHWSLFLGTKTLTFFESIPWEKDFHLLGFIWNSLNSGVINIGSLNIDKDIFLIIRELEYEKKELKIINKVRKNKVYFAKFIFILK